MKISLLTLFPSLFKSPLNESILKRAQKEKKVTIRLINIRDFATDHYKTVDDHPYGGGTGMILKVDVLHRALQHTLSHSGKSGQKADASRISNKPLDSGVTRHGGLPRMTTRVILLDPAGPQFAQKKAQEFSHLDHLILICGHYEGVDARIENYIDEKLSIGPYVLTGGEIPALVVVDAVTRLIPGVLKKKDATLNESFSTDEKGVEYLEYPQYTRPQVYEGKEVPEVLLSGNHKEIETWKKKMMRYNKFSTNNLG